MAISDWLRVSSEQTDHVLSLEESCREGCRGSCASHGQEQRVQSCPPSFPWGMGSWQLEIAVSSRCGEMWVWWGTGSEPSHSWVGPAWTPALSLGGLWVLPCGPLPPGLSGGRLWTVLSAHSWVSCWSSGEFRLRQEASGGHGWQVHLKGQLRGLLHERCG